MATSIIKKVMCLVVVTFLITSVFTGCGSNKGDKATGVDNLTTIRVWTGFGHTKDMLNEMINDYNKTTGKERGIRIEYTAYGGDYKQVFDLALNGGQAAELLKINGDKRPYVQRGDLVPITDMPGGQKFIDEYDMPLVDGYSVFDDKVYSVPTNVTTIGLVYNKDLFKEVGIVDENGEALPPKTWDEVREYAKMITDSEKMVYGISIPLKDASFYNSWQLRNPFLSSYNELPEIDWDNLTYDYSDLQHAYEWLLGIKEDNSFFPGAESLDNDAARAQFADGRIGMFLGASWDVGVLTSQFTAKCDWGVAPVPVKDVNDKYKQYQNVSDFLCISSSALKTDKEKVMEVYEWFHTNDMWTKMYEEERDIPYRYELIENSDTTNISPQWSQFAELVAIGRDPKPSFSVKLEGENESGMMLRVWAGIISVDDAVKSLNETYTSALKKGVEDGSIDVELHKQKIDYRLE